MGVLGTGLLRLLLWLLGCGRLHRHRMPGQCWMLKEYRRHFSFSLKRRGLCTLLRSLSPNIPVSGWWSVTTIICGQPMTNIQHFSSAQAIAAASPSIGAYRRPVSVQNVLPANTMRHPSEQHTGAFSGGGGTCSTSAIIGSPCLLCSNLGLGRLPCWCRGDNSFFNQAHYDLFGLLECFFQAFIPNKECVFLDKVLKWQHYGA